MLSLFIVITDSIITDIVIIITDIIIIKYHNNSIKNSILNLIGSHVMQVTNSWGLRENLRAQHMIHDGCLVSGSTSGHFMFCTLVKGDMIQICFIKPSIH